MPAENIDKIFQPASVAMVGASEKKGSIGAALLQQCLAIDAARSLKKVTGTVFAENTQMLVLGRRLGFEIRKSAGTGKYELSKNITTD